MPAEAKVLTWPWRKGGMIMLFSGLALLAIGLALGGAFVIGLAIAIGMVTSIEGVACVIRKKDRAIFLREFWICCALIAGGLGMLMVDAIVEPETDWVTIGGFMMTALGMSQLTGKPRR